jgi:cysteine-rich repeat protein
MLRFATTRQSLIIPLACAALLAASCGDDTSTGAVCGDWIIEGDEVCDDGNTDDGDGCSSTCTLESAVCGNNIIEDGEVCDDGNTNDGDGCDSACELEVPPGCGNGVVELGEDCDDGNTDECDGCSATCSVEQCGNNVTECTEECDDGNATPGDGCDTDCTVETGGCGDNVIDAGEECDDGNTTNGDGCDQDCQLEVMPGCGNGVREIGEECDDGNLDICDGCSAGCDIEICGNGVRECTEECDDGNTTDGDGCDATCHSEVVLTCGNGTLETGEECDDGDTDNTDACLNNCTNAGCGDSYIWVGTEQCDDGNTSSGDGCSIICQLEVTPGCGNGVREIGEACDDGDTTACDGCSATCTVEACGNGTVECAETCDDANVDNTDACLNNCTDASCGDNYIWAGTEACDDGGTTSGDGCDATCQIEGCGNGTVEGGEGCDDGNGVNTDACPDGVGGTCQPAACGDGFIEATVDECDDGNTNNGDGCDANCDIEIPECLDQWPLTCADSDDWNNGGMGSTDVIDTHGCNSWDENGPEYAYLFVATTSENVTVGLSAMTADLDIFIIDDQGGVCDPTNCLAAGKGSVTFAAVAGTTYYIVVDGFAGALGDYTVTVVCPSTPGCGDSTVQGGEDCDDGNFDDTDSCVTGCVDASCGDGFLQTAVEDCDDGNTNNGDGCRNDCTIPVCGDFIVDTGEDCDDGNTDDFDGCSASCAAETCEQDQWPLACGGSDTYNNGWGVSPNNEISTYSCAPSEDESGPETTYLFTATADGFVVIDLTVNTPGEDLDVFVISQSNGQCSPTSCTTAGDDQALFYAVAGEVYYIIVDGYQGSVAGYDIDMTCYLCGDGNLDFGEECDDGNTSSGDGCDASCEVEGAQCFPRALIDCGDTDNWHNLGGGHTNNITTYSCNSRDESGPEYTYYFAPTNSGNVTVDLSGMTDDLDLYVLTDPGTDCDPTNCMAYGDNSVTFAVTGGETYFIIVDGFEGALSEYTLDMSCTNP